MNKDDVKKLWQHVKDVETALKSWHDETSFLRRQLELAVEALRKVKQSGSTCEAHTVAISAMDNLCVNMQGYLKKKE